MKKLTRKQRLDALRNGFYKCGFVQIKDLKELESDLARIADQLTDEFENKVRAINTRLLIDTIRSKDFIDNEGCFYDFSGMTYQHGQFLIHVYTNRDNSGQASITLLA